MARFDSGGGSEEDDQQDQQERDVLAGEGGTEDPAGAADELTGRDPGSGGGGGGGRTRDPHQQADEQLTGRDPGSGGGRSSQGAGSGAAGSGAVDSGEGGAGGGGGGADTESVSGQGSGAARGGVSPQSRQAAGEIVDTTLEEGVEEGGIARTHPSTIQDQAAVLERRFIDESEFADDPSDVAVRREGDQLVAGLSRSAAVDITAREIEEFTEPENLVGRTPKRIFAGTERVPVGVDVDREDLDIEVGETAAGEDRVSVSFADEIQRDIARQRFASTEGVDADSVEVEETDAGFVARSGEQPSDAAESDVAPKGFDRLREGVDVDIEPIQHRRESLEGGEGPPGGPLFTPPSVDVDVDTEALGLPGRDDIAERAPTESDVGRVERSGPRRGPGSAPSTTRGGFDPSSADVDPEFDAENVSFIPTRDTIGELAPSGDVESVERSGPRRGPGSAPSTTRGSFDPSSEDVDVDVDLDIVPDFPEPSDGDRSPGDFQRSPRGRGADSSPERTAEIVEPSDEATTPDPDPVSLREIVGAPAAAVASVTPSLFPDDVDSAARDADPQRRGPGSGPSTTRGSFDPSSVDVDPDVSVDLELPPAGERFVEDAEAGFPQGVEAGESDPPALEAGAAAGAARGRTVDPVRGLVTRSPLSPGRRARTVGKIVAGGAALGAGALTVEEVTDERDEPAVETAGTATEVGVGERVTTTELEVTEDVTDVAEIEVSRDVTDIDELEPTGMGPTTTRVDVTEPGRTTRVELPGSDVGDGAGGGVPVDDSVVPGEFPLPGRDLPRNPLEDRPRQPDPTELIDPTATTAPAFGEGTLREQQREREEEPLSELMEEFRQARKRRRRERAEARERELASAEKSRGMLDDRARRVRDLPRPGEDLDEFTALREFPTGASAVVGAELSRVEDAETLEVAEDVDDTILEDIGGRVGTQPDIAAAVDTALQQSPAEDVATTPETTTATVPEVATQLETVPENVTEVMNETVTLPENAFGQGQGFGTGRPARRLKLPDLDGGGTRDRKKPRFDFFSREFVYEFEGEPGQVADDLLTGIGGDLDDLDDLEPF